MPEGLESIGERWFGDASIREIVIPKSVKSIGNDAFYDCENLTSVILQEGLESIGDYCFSGYYDAEYYINNAPKIREITIPRTVKSIG